MKALKYLLLNFALIGVIGCSSTREKQSQENSPEKDPGKEITTNTVKEEKAQPPLDAYQQEIEKRIQENEKQIAETLQSYPDSLVAVLERTSCYGRCPTYKVNVYKSGYTEYNGKRWVDKTGLYATNLTREEINKIIAKAKEMQFFDMKNYYDSQIVDFPSTYIFIRDNGNKKLVKDRHAAPAEYKELATFMDTILDGKEWIAIDPVEMPEDK